MYLLMILLIGKTTPLMQKNKDYGYRDSSIAPRSNENGFIDDNLIGINNDGFRFCNTRLRKSKIPQMVISFLADTDKKEPLEWYTDKKICLEQKMELLILS